MGGAGGGSERCGRQRSGRGENQGKWRGNLQQGRGVKAEDGGDEEDGGTGGQADPMQNEIGRASCRERV